MASVAALLETSHRIPNLDYQDLFRLTGLLTRDQRQTSQLYRRMCFNVYAHNRDDHSKNFSFLYDNNGWRLSPAYDLTYSSSINGWHATTIGGNGENPGTSDLLSVAQAAGISRGMATEIAEEIESKVHEQLGEIIESYR